MKNKYVMIRGFAFSEKSDMEKLRNYAKEGWMLEGISVNLFYKLKKGKPQDIQYSLDYQDEATKEYFDLFLEAGWTLVVSICNKTHIFSAPVGTKPIYTEAASEIDKYSSIKDQTKKAVIFFFIAVIVLAGGLKVSSAFMKPAFFVTFILFTISVALFVPSLMTYLALNHRINKLKKN